MPCRDYYDEHPEHYFKDVTEPALRQRISFTESALCQALEAIQQILINAAAVQDDPLAYINYQEAGITYEELEKWWKEHKALDAMHRKEELENKARKVALAKLTDEEKKLLGLIK